MHLHAQRSVFTCLSSLVPRFSDSFLDAKRSKEKASAHTHTARQTDSSSSRGGLVGYTRCVASPAFFFILSECQPASAGSLLTAHAKFGFTSKDSIFTFSTVPFSLRITSAELLALRLTHPCASDTATTTHYPFQWALCGTLHLSHVNVCSLSPPLLRLDAFCSPGFVCFCSLSLCFFFAPCRSKYAL